MLIKNSINYFSSSESTETEEERKRRWFSIPYILKIIAIFASILMIVSAILLATSGLSPYYLLAFAIMTAGSLILQGILEYVNNKDNNIDPKNKSDINEFGDQVHKQVEEIQSKRYEGSEAPNIKDEIAKLNLNIEKNLLVEKNGEKNLEFSILDFAEAIAEGLYKHLDECFESKEVKDTFDNLNNELVKSFPNTKKITLAELKKHALDNVLHAFSNEKELIQSKSDDNVFDLYNYDYNKIKKKSNSFNYSYQDSFLNPIIDNQKKEIKTEYQDRYRKEERNGEIVFIQNSLLYRAQHINELNENQKNKLMYDINDTKSDLSQITSVVGYNNIYNFIESIINDSIINEKNKNVSQNIIKKQKEFKKPLIDFNCKNQTNIKLNNIQVTDIKNLNEEIKK